MDVLRDQTPSTLGFLVNPACPAYADMCPQRYADADGANCCCAEIVEDGAEIVEDEAEIVEDMHS